MTSKYSCFIAVVCATLVLAVGGCASQPASPSAKQPRIVNLYNFIRNSDYRVPNSEEVLFETTRQQLELAGRHGLPATWALQYDALINPRYQTLLKEKAAAQDEIAAWWEIPRPLAEKAGIKWRGAHDWDSTAQIGFSPGYTPDERRKLVDVYMADFKAVFGRYPLTVGSWYIDEVTLAYMADRYGVIASCNCKDQIGTDGYTLWGGYWNQAYYPSKLNAYMPAQSKAGQINVPIFRMLGSDPIYQYSQKYGIVSLEPVYPRAGGSPAWVKWFFDEMIHQPSLAFAYTQAGQENSFGWDAMKAGFTQQVELLDKLFKAGEIRVETLAETGKWFRENHPLTPATAVVCLNDWKNEGRKTVWYNSRFYRINLLWEDGGLSIRDIHRFDETRVSETHDTPLKTASLAYGTLPIVNGFDSTAKVPVGAFPILVSTEGKTSPLAFDGLPIVREKSSTELSIKQAIRGGGTLSILCSDQDVAFEAIDGLGKPLSWRLDMRCGDHQPETVTLRELSFKSPAGVYALKLASNAGTFVRIDESTIALSPNASGKLKMSMTGK